jgi:Flp pilus assembly protein TadG
MNWPRVDLRLRDHGQALPEFALVAPLLFILLFGVLQFGFLFGGHVGLTNAARDAARYASVLQVGDAGTATTNAAATMTELTKVGGFLSRAIPGYQSGNLVTAGAGRTAVCYAAFQNPDLTWSVRVRVQIAYRHPLFIPLVGAFVDGFDGSTDGSWRTTASEEMRVENPVLDFAPSGLPTCP